MVAPIKIDRRQKLAKKVENVEALLDKLKYEAPVADSQLSPQVDSQKSKINMAVIAGDTAQAAKALKPIDKEADTRMQEEGHALAEEFARKQKLIHVTKNVWLRDQEKCAIRVVVRSKYLLSLSASSLKAVDTVLLLEKTEEGHKVSELDAKEFMKHSRFVLGVAGVNRGKDVYTMPLVKALEVASKQPVHSIPVLLPEDLGIDSDIDR
jgi:uncharacterized protein YlxP (DUF503 family)